MPATFICSLVTPDAAVFEKEVDYVSLPAHDGLVGIAPGRAPLMVKLGMGPLRLEYEGKTETYLIDGGFAQMKGEVLTLISQKATQADDISATSAKTEMDEAEKLPSLTDEEFDKRQTELERARLMAKIAE